MIALILGPEVERQAGEFIHFGNGGWISREIHDLEVPFAALASLKSQV